MTENATLVTTTKNLSSQSTRALYAGAYNLLDHAQQILQTINHRTCICCNYKVPDAESVDILRNLDEGTAGYAGLMKCSSLWTCPVCARKMSEKRRIELQEVVDAAKANGDRVCMVTLTHQHNAGDTLKESSKEMRKAWGRWRNGRWWMEMLEWMGMVGTVRALEVTHGDKNGWHVHFHVLFFFSDNEITTDEIETHMSGRWRQVLNNMGGFASRAHGCVVTENEADIATYVNKHGEQVTKAVEKQQQWTESHELAKQVTKKGKIDDRRTPFQILSDGMEGDKRSDRLFREYGIAMKGFQQLVYSAGLKKHYTDEDEKTDEELNDENDGELVVSMDIGLFRYISRIGARGWLLDAAATGKDTELHTFVDYMREKRDDRANTIEVKKIRANIKRKEDIRAATSNKP